MLSFIFRRHLQMSEGVSSLLSLFLAGVHHHRRDSHRADEEQADDKGPRLLVFILLHHHLLLLLSAASSHPTHPQAEARSAAGGFWKRWACVRHLSPNHI